MLLTADKVPGTCTNVVVDLVSRGTCDEPPTDVTPCSINAALVELAGVRRQTLVFVWRTETRQMHEGEECEAEHKQ